jgi:type IV secretion system protein VirB1
MDMPAITHQIEQCAPSAPTAIIEAIIRTESEFNPLAIHVNRGAKLARQPASRKEAVTWARWLQENGYSFDAGVMQINSANWGKLGLTPDNVFDACKNIRSGAELFTEYYSRAEANFRTTKTSLVAALSAYNTGDFTSGLKNGYVSRVMGNTRFTEVEVVGTPPIVPGNKSSQCPGSKPSKNNTESESNGDEPNPFIVPSTVDSFGIEELKPWDIEPSLEPQADSEDTQTSDATSRHSHGWQIGFPMKNRRALAALVLVNFFLARALQQQMLDPVPVGLIQVVKNGSSIGDLATINRNRGRFLCRDYRPNPAEGYSGRDLVLG